MTTFEKHRGDGLFYLKAGTLFFWGMWFLLASLTNIFDLFNVFGILTPEWRFRSGNYLLLSQALSIYDVGSMCTNLLFICDILVQGTAATLFFIAAWHFWHQKNAWIYINAAFTLSIALWGMFIIMEETFIAYAFEEVHRSLFSLELISLLALHLLP